MLHIALSSSVPVRRGTIRLQAPSPASLYLQSSATGTRHNAGRQRPVQPAPPAPSTHCTRRPRQSGRFPDPPLRQHGRGPPRRSRTASPRARRWRAARFPATPHERAAIPHAAPHPQRSAARFRPASSHACASPILGKLRATHPGGLILVKRSKTTSMRRYARRRRGLAPGIGGIDRARPPPSSTYRLRLCAANTIASRDGDDEKRRWPNGTYLSLFSVENSITVSAPC